MGKNIIKFFTVSIFSFFAFVLGGCADINTDAYVFYSDAAVITNGIRNVVFDVSSDTTLLKVSSIARTITPAAYDSNALKFYIGGKNIGTGEKMPAKEVEFIADENSASSGKITVPLNSYNYQLSLLAIPATTNITLGDSVYISDLAVNAVLAGSTTVDLRYSDNSDVNFYLSSSGLTGNGTYDIDFYLANWSTASLSTKDPVLDAPVINNVLFAVYPLGSDIPVFGTNSNQSLSLCQTEADAFKYSDSIPAGTYELCATFSFNGKKFIYGDKIVILPYQTTSAVIAIPDVLQVVPVAPSNFKQGYILPENYESDFYKVVFTWQDNANTETGFEIQILDTNTVYETVSSFENTENRWNIDPKYISTYTSAFVGSSEWYAGGLSRNDTSVIFTMPLGKRYLARIRSVNNDIGASEWCYASSDSFSITIPSGESTADELSLASPKTFSATAFNSSRINLFKISYNLYGGTITPACPTTYYFDQIDGGTPVLSPNGTAVNAVYNSGNPVTVANDGAAWKAWKISSVDGSTYPNSFKKCPSADFWSADKTFYSARNLSHEDINGSMVYYEKSDPQPTQEDFDTGNKYLNYYYDEGILNNYLGYKNLSLYAQYEDNTPVPVNTDYSIKTNLTITHAVDGGTATSEKSFNLSLAGTTTLYINFGYKTGAPLSSSEPYTSVSLSISEDEGSEVATYVASGQSFLIPTSVFKTDTDYIITIKAIKAGAVSTTTMLLTTED